MNKIGLSLNVEESEKKIPGSVPLSESTAEANGVYSGPRHSPPSKICENPFSSFCVILLTNQPNNKHGLTHDVWQW